MSLLLKYALNKLCYRDQNKFANKISKLFILYYVAVVKFLFNFTDF